MIRAVALVDLDDTLFQTLRKRPDDVPEADMTPVGYAKTGEPLSYATPRQMSFSTWLSETTRLIPVTARSLDALRRVRIPYTAAICAHGAVLLDDRGQVDAEWAAEIADLAAEHAPALAELAARIEAAAAARNVRLNVRVLTEDGVGIYVLAKHPDADEAVLHAVVDDMAHALPPGWTQHRNGNNVALMPPFLGKARAVERLLPRLRAEHPAAPIIGIGDSLTDAPFMALCDFAMTPRGSQLAAAFPGCARA